MFDLKDTAVFMYKASTYIYIIALILLKKKGVMFIAN